MKLIRIFGVVLALHVVGGLLFFQPGCQSKPRPQATETAPRTGEPMARLDAEPTDSHVESDRPRSAPTRPARSSSNDASSDDLLRPLPSDPIPSLSDAGSRDRESGGTYKVRSGDSLWAIANRNNVSLSALLAANGLTENSVIQPGQELRLPSGATSSSGSASKSAPVAPEGTTTYKVRSGDSLSVIAQRHNTTVANLKKLNNMSSDVIRIDQSLIVPAGGSTSRSQSPAPSASASASRSANGTRHTVKSGETPGGIAKNYGVTIDELMSANNISDPRRMQIGQELVIPGKKEPKEEPAPKPAPAREEPKPEPKPEPAPTEPIVPIEDEDDFPIIPILPNN